MAIRTADEKAPRKGVRTSLIPLVFWVLAVLPVPGNQSAALNRAASQLTVHPLLLAEEAVQVSTTTTVEHLIGKGDTFRSILARYGVSNEEIQQWCNAARPKANISRLVVGRELVMTFDGPQLTSLRYAVDDERQLVVERDDWAEIQARFEALRVEVRTAGARGVISSSFHESAEGTGIPDPVISEMVDLLGWKIDFNTDVQPGDQFRVLYEERTDAQGRLLKPGHILAADFSGRTRSAAAFRYEDDNGEAVYLDAKGEPLERTFLRYPLEFTSITSSFSYARFHPILRQTRPHLGVDFAAPPGTPVRAIGTGEVAFAGWKSGFGNHLEVDHGDGFVSVYSHLRAFRPGIRVGAPVKQGQLIGSVGQTGLATGPHLHFAIFEDGRYVNPLNMKQPIRQVHVAADRFAFVHAELSRELRNISGGGGTVSSQPALALSAVEQARQLGPVVLTM